MGLPVTVYRWDDEGAPQIVDGRPSDILSILKKCLVEGYGTKQALGWRVLFDDAGNTKTVFKSSETVGTGGCFQFWATNGEDASNKSMRFRAAKSITAFDVFTAPQYLQTFIVNQLSKFWVIIGTERGFYMMFNKTLSSPARGTTSGSNFFIGDLDSFVPNDPGAFISLQRATFSDSTPASWSYCMSYTMRPNAPACKIYDTDGSDNYFNYRYDGAFMPGTSNINGVPDASVRMFSEPTLYTANESSDRDGVRGSNSVLRPYHRGKIAGMLNSPQTGYADQPWPVIETINGELHMLMCGYNFGRTWINMERWYA